MSIWSDLGIQEWRRRSSPAESEQLSSTNLASDAADPDPIKESALRIVQAEELQPEEVRSEEVRSEEVRSEEVRSEETQSGSRIGRADSREEMESQGSEVDMPQSLSNPSSERAQVTWKELVEAVQNPSTCTNCAPVNAVLGDGDIQARWVFVIDSPSQQDIQAQQLLSGRAGQLFDAILAAAQLTRADVYLTSVFKCPPNADFKVSSQCGHLIHQQLELVQPEVIVCLGEFPAQALMRANEDLNALRRLELRYSSSKVPLFASHSMAQLLETPSLKRDLWNDIKAAMALVKST